MHPEAAAAEGVPGYDRPCIFDNDWDVSPSCMSYTCQGPHYDTISQGESSQDHDFETTAM